MAEVSLTIKLMELLPKPSAFLSLVASYVFMRELWADRFYRGEKVIPRVLFALAFGGLFRSIGWFLTTWASPKELPYLWLNAGNTATCTFQGFMVNFGLQLSYGMYCFLFWCYLLILRYSWPDYKLARREKWGHGIILGYAGLSAVLPLFWGMYNNLYPICYIAEYPLGCRGFTYGDEGTSGGYPCIRGKKAWVVNEVYSYIPKWITVFTGIVAMSMIYCSVRRLERRNAEYAGSRSTQHFTVEMSTTLDNRRTTSEPHQPSPPPPPEPLYVNRKKSRAVAAQAYWYTGTFLATWALDLVGSTMLYFGKRWWPPLTLVSFTVMPLQPLFNFLVFGRTREQMKTPEGRFLWKILCCRSNCCKNRCCKCRLAACPTGRKLCCFKWLRRSFSSSSPSSSSSSSRAEGEAESSSNTPVRENNNNNNNSVGSNSNNNKTTGKSREATALEEKRQQQDKNDNLSRMVASESVEIQFGPDSQFEQPNKRSRVIPSESVEIAFVPDSQFEQHQEEASAAVSSETETRRDSVAMPHGGNGSNSGSGGIMAEAEAPAATGDGGGAEHAMNHR